VPAEEKEALKQCYEGLVQSLDVRLILFNVEKLRATLQAPLG
jgi:hypothetical protein